MDFFRSFDAAKLRLKLKLAETRIELVKNKKTNEIKKQKIEVANLLRNGQEELARIRTEHLVCDDFRIEVLGILGLLCALLKERTKLLENSREIPFDMKESCATLAFAADRVSEIPELGDIKQQLMYKYKKELTSWLLTEDTAQQNVNERVFKKLGVKPPNAFIVTSYMKFIAQEAEINWEPKEDFNMRTDLPSSAPRGKNVAPGAGSGIDTPYLVNDGFLSPAAAAYMNAPPPRNDDDDDGGDFTVPKMFDKKPTKQQPQEQQTNVYEFNPPPMAPRPAAPSFAPPPPTTDQGVPDFDELTARFNALKRG